MTQEEIRLDVESGFGANTKQPFVDLLLRGRSVIKMSPGKAREVALLLLESAEAADTDAFLYETMGAKIDMPAAAATIKLFREWRQAHRKDTQ